MLSYLKVPVGWGEIFKRTFGAVNKDDVLGLAAQLAYAFFFSLFPMLIFLVAVASFFPLNGLIDQLTARAGTVLPEQMTALVTDQLKQLSNSHQGGLLTFGILLTVFSASAGMASVVNALNHAYDIAESRPWWKVRLIAIGLTVAIGIFALIALTLVMVGPGLAERVADWVGLGGTFALAWKILQWPVAFLFVVSGVALVYYYAPDADQDFVLITPGSLLATFLWVVASLGFKFYIANFNSYNATYGAIGGIMIALTWLYMSGIMLLVGAEMNAEIEHASPYGKEPGEKVPGEKTGMRRKIGRAAARAWEEAQRLRHRHPATAHTAAQSSSAPAAPAATRARPLPTPAFAASRERAGTSRVVLAGVIAGEVAMAAWRTLRRPKTGA